MFSGPDKNSKVFFWATLVIVIVGLHSILLGLIIYFLTGPFYRVFFAVDLENLFFVRQSGIFLFVMGLFYLYPLSKLRNRYNFILLVITSKVVAVIFLISNAEFTAAPRMVYLATFLDGLMAMVLVAVYFLLRKEVSLTTRGIGSGEEAGLKEAG